MTVLNRVLPIDTLIQENVMASAAQPTQSHPFTYQRLKTSNNDEGHTNEAFSLAEQIAPSSAKTRSLSSSSVTPAVAERAFLLKPLADTDNEASSEPTPQKSRSGLFDTEEIQDGLVSIRHTDSHLFTAINCVRSCCDWFFSTTDSHWGEILCNALIKINAQTDCEFSGEPAIYRTAQLALFIYIIHHQHYDGNKNEKTLAFERLEQAIKPIFRYCYMVLDIKQFRKIFSPEHIDEQTFSDYPGVSRIDNTASISKTLKGQLDPIKYEHLPPFIINMIKEGFTSTVIEEQLKLSNDEMAILAADRHNQEFADIYWDLVTTSTRVLVENKKGLHNAKFICFISSSVIMTIQHYLKYSPSHTDTDHSQPLMSAAKHAPLSSDRGESTDSSTPSPARTGSALTCNTVQPEEQEEMLRLLQALSPMLTEDPLNEVMQLTYDAFILLCIGSKFPGIYCLQEAPPVQDPPSVNPDQWYPENLKQQEIFGFFRLFSHDILHLDSDPRCSCWQWQERTVTKGDLVAKTGMRSGHDVPTTVLIAEIADTHLKNETLTPQDIIDNMLSTKSSDHLDDIARFTITRDDIKHMERSGYKNIPGIDWSDETQCSNWKPTEEKTWLKADTEQLETVAIELTSARTFEERVMMTKKLLRRPHDIITIPFQDINSGQDIKLHFEISGIIQYKQSIADPKRDTGLRGHYLVTIKDDDGGYLLYDDERVYKTDGKSFHGAHVGYTLKKIATEDGEHRIKEALSQQTAPPTPATVSGGEPDIGDIEVYGFRVSDRAQLLETTGEISL
ncbi:hypothetical protein ElyMa_004307800 [Elysia marginata]|uniref:USP domain-containing protein n=1 Tax=Elysia marginata TaxID=1093978 RepID=A0AAV4GYU6_9GAST|nr:hypothetical protein ElyMa_004307800 [Elysia marginata]